ncbi:MAG: ferritin family protein [Acidobacteria bacterium]|jgi:rubrerythrin|nr:ferritin family protein [Acidobacteriota bacterium]
MAETIDFPSLSLQDALDLAILVEEEAQERYLEFVDQMEQHRTPEAAEFFRSMAGNEAKHGEELRSRRKARFGDAPPRVDRSMLWDVEAPDYGEPRAFMSARQAMGVALRAETKAHEFFAKALPHITDPEVRTLFDELREEEIGHQNLVREAMRSLPRGPEPDPDDYVDEPAAQ